jgi:heme-degrading monooxygenase HmoA
VLADRYEVREQALHGQAGYVPWDLLGDRENEQPGLAHSHWSPSRARVEAWVARENEAYSLRRQRSAGSTKSAVSAGRPSGR